MPRPVLFTVTKLAAKSGSEPGQSVSVGSPKNLVVATSVTAPRALIVTV